ncbi:MAG: glycosyltransferase family 2 protein [Candidatus Dormibacteraceae bacterium]
MTLKFSVLLPTRNRLEYLKYAVETVRRQDYDDWEIIIADNNSDDDIAGFVQTQDDARLKYSRSDRFLPVTDNWNIALELSSGDFVIMLGDDDGLMKGYFTRARYLIAKFGSPDLIYSSGYLYAYPGVLPKYPDGILHHYRNATFLQAGREPFLFSHQSAMKLVHDSLDFKMKFTYNMQYSLFARSLVEDMLRDGPFFQSPFPDYYATNVMFMKAKRILIDPEPTVAVGITPKSYGFFLFNNREGEGVEFLNSPGALSDMSPNGRPMLPGSNMNNSWLLAMEAMAQNYGLKLNYGRYRRLQILTMLRSRIEGHLPDEEYRMFWTRIRPVERAIYGPGLSVISWVLRRLRGKSRLLFRRLVGASARWFRASNEWLPPAETRSYGNMLEVFEGVTSGGDALGAGSSTA